MNPIKIVAISHSLHRRSSSRAATEAVLAGAQQAGVEVVKFDVRSMALPHYTWGETPPEVEPLVDAVRSAHGMVWCSPLYHGSISGTFKNTLDWLELLSSDDSPYLTDKVVALISTAGGDQALQAINTMECIVRALRGWTLPLTAPIARARDAFDDHGEPRDPALAERLLRMGRELVRSARLLSHPLPEVKNSVAEHSRRAAR